MAETIEPALEAALDPKAWAEAVKAPYLGVPIWVALADGMMSAPQARVLIAAYLAAASPQAEIDRLREALRKALPHLEENARWHRDMQSRAGVTERAFKIVETVTAALHPEPPNGDRNG